MNSFLRGKNWVVLLALVALTGLIVLASGLSSVQFDNPARIELDKLLTFSNPTDSGGVTVTPWIRYLVLGMFLVLFLLMLGPIRPQTGRNLMMQLLRFFAIAFVLLLIAGRLAQKNHLVINEEEAAVNGASGTLQPFSTPEVSAQWEFWITAAIVLVIGGIAIALGNRLIDRWFRPKQELNQIAEIARSTLNDLSETKESRDVIIRCYARMNAVVDQYRGIRRDAATTPAEFAQRLEHAGLPPEEVGGLTRVFERVRYGGETVSAEEIKEARNCLTGILKACEAPK